MSLSRFYLPPSAWRSESLTLTGDEAVHCLRVQRHQVGDAIEVADGAGRVAVAAITAVSKGEAQLRVLELHQHEPLPFAIHLLPALIKAEAFEWLLEKAVELGAASIRPMVTERSVVQLSGEHLEKKMAKWRRLMIESAKQCHTPFLPELHTPKPFAQVIPAVGFDGLKLLPVLSEQSRTVHEVLGEPSGIAGEVHAAIGPEGDFTTQEEDLARQYGFVPVTLGPLVLRAETAGIAMLAILAHEMRRAPAAVAVTHP